MPTGQATIKETGDSLLGANQIQPTPVPIPRLQAPNVAAPDVTNTMQAKVAHAVTGFVGEQLQAATDITNEAKYLDGQMAAAQGQAFEDLEMDGNKWSMAGYRAVEAGTITATMLAAQQEMLRQVDFQDDPDAYRAKYVQRLETQLEGLDPKTARMVREQMAKQAPALAAQHTTAHMAHQESEAYKALEHSIDIMSMDDTQLDGLLSNASGDGSAFYGLSTARRESAVAQGVVRAFENGNPLAYAKLKKSGVLDEFSTGQLQLINNAYDGYQTKLRGIANAEYEEDLAALQTEINAGNLSGPASMQKLSELMATHGIEMRANEGHAAFVSAKDANELNRKGTALLVDEAKLRGDYTTIANLTFNALGFVESTNNPNAVGKLITAGANAGDRAIGEHQIMPKTIAKPGYGIRGGDPSNPADVTRVSKAYWTAMLAGSAGGYKLPWPPGDIEAAAVAYNAGPANATKWFNAGRDYNELPRPGETKPYAAKLLARVNGSDITMSAQGKFNAAQDLFDATQARVNMQAHEEIADERQAITDDFMNGVIDYDEFVQQDNALFDRADIVRTQADSNHLITSLRQFTNEANAALENDAKEQNDLAAENRKEAIDVQVAALKGAYDGAMSSDTMTHKERLVATQAYTDQVRKLYADAGFTPSEYGEANLVEQTASTWNAANKRALKAQQEQTVIAHARATGSVAELSPEQNRKAWSGIREDVAKTVSDAVAAKGGTPEEQQALQHELTVDSWRNNGQVDPLVGKGNSAILNGRLLAEDGMPNPQVVGTVNQYHELLLSDPTLAMSFFSDDAARMKANAILTAGNNDPVEGVMNMTNQLEAWDRANPKLSKEQIAVMSSDEAIQQAQVQDVGFWQGLFTSGINAWTEQWKTTGREYRAREEAAKETMGPLLERELQTLQYRNDMPPNLLMDTAVQNVTNSVSFLGQSVVEYERGNDFLTQAVGKAEANKYASKPGVEDDILSSYIMEHAEELGMAGITEFSSLEYGFLQRMGRATLDVVPELFGFDGFQDPAMGFVDTQAAITKGIRPYIVNTNAQGQTVVRYTDMQGHLTEGVVIDPAKAGKWWLSQQPSVQPREDTDLGISP